MANAKTGGGAEENRQQSSLSTAAARKLATTTKSPPMMQGVGPRWLLKFLPWVEVPGGTFRVNRRMSYAVGDGRLSFSNIGAKVQVVPEELAELPLLRGYEDPEFMNTLATKFIQREYKPGDIIVEKGKPAELVVLIAHGKVNKLGTGKYGDEIVLETLADGDHFGDQSVVESDDFWEYTVKATTPCTCLVMPQQVFEDLILRSKTLSAHVEKYKESLKKPQDKAGQAAIVLAAGHHGEQVLPGTYVNYDLAPREYELSVAQTVLRVHSRVSDLFNDPMDQVREQVRLTIEAMRELQEHEMINNRDFGFLHNADLKQRINTRNGPPTPDDMDDLLCRRRKTKFFLAHPRTIAAFSRECNKRGVFPTNVEVEGGKFLGWRGVPIVPCDKIPISEQRTSAILAMRVGLDQQGVIGLHRTGIPEEVEPSLSVRKMSISEKAIGDYLVTAYFSAAIMIPDALGVLENVELGHYY